MHLAPSLMLIFGVGFMSDLSIFEAIEAGDEARVTALLRSGADPNASRGGDTPLQAAVRKSDRAIIALLIEQGADPRRRGSMHRTCFRVAFERDPELAGWMLARVDKPTVIDAAEAGTLDDVRRVVAAGGDVGMTSRDDLRWTALHAATTRGDREIAAFLLERGADPNARALGGATPLFAAARSAALVELLIRHGADPDAADDEGRTPLYYVAQGIHAEVMAALIRGGADVNARARNGYTPLHSAAHLDSEPAIRMLVKNGADLDARDGRGFTPLHVAIDTIKPGAARLLLDLGADPKVRDEEGRTPGRLAAGIRDPGIRALLRERRLPK